MEEDIGRPPTMSHFSYYTRLSTQKADMWQPYCQPILVIISTLIIHHSFNILLHAQNLPFQQILPTLSLLLCLLDFFFQSVLCSSVAVSTICRHLSRVVAFLQAVARPKFRGPRSASVARSQVWLGLPAVCFQSGSTCRIHAIGLPS